MQIKNPVWTADGRIDCDVEFPELGWLPFTADRNDVEAHGRAIFAAAFDLGPSPHVPRPASDAMTLWRATAKCSPMQGKLALGQANWAKIEAYRATATWAEQVVIDSAQEWRRNSQDIQFFGYMLDFSDEQMDALFVAAMQIKA